MSDDFYDRKPATHLDGSLMFNSAEDRAAEDQIAAKLAELWQCEFHRFGLLSPIDWYTVREGRLAAVVEFKRRSHASDTYSTVFLNVRKWLALSLAEIGLGVPAVYVVQFTDDVRWCKVAGIDATKVKIAGVGKARAVTANADVEPIIEVPVAGMKQL